VKGVFARRATEMGENREIELPQGRLRLRVLREDIPVDDAIGFAARRNPKRPFLFVSKRLGRHLPTRPKDLRETAEMLIRKLKAIPMEGPILFFGMAETATALGQAVFYAWSQEGNAGLYIDTTRRKTAGTIAFGFQESHSHAVEHFVHLPAIHDDPSEIFKKAKTIVIVDDEATTAQTAQRLLFQYEMFTGRNVRLLLAVIASWVEKPSQTNGVEVISLIEGRAAFESKVATEAEADLSHLPRQISVSASPAPRGSRHGLCSPQTITVNEHYLGQKILVVGVGEFLYPPLLLAEALEARGSKTWLQATTRSPIQQGGAIQHVREFAALTGEAYIEYLYNVPSDHPYDRVVICPEGPLDIPGDHPLRDIPRLDLCFLKT